MALCKAEGLNVTISDTRSECTWHLSGDAPALTDAGARSLATCQSGGGPAKVEVAAATTVLRVHRRPLNTPGLKVDARILVPCRLSSVLLLPSPFFPRSSRKPQRASTQQHGAPL